MSSTPTQEISEVASLGTEVAFLASEVAFSLLQEKQTNSVDLSWVFLEQSGRAFGVVFDRENIHQSPR